VRAELCRKLSAGAGGGPGLARDEPYAIRALISAGVGIGLLPAVARKTAEHPRVAWLHLDAPGGRRTLSLVWRSDAYLSAAARAFTTFAAAHAWPSDS
jgi:DNA-binding transcriptional LysR family regulator